MITPLNGLRIVVPRAEAGNAPLLRLLADAGAVAVSVPLIEIAPPSDTGPLDRALARLAAGGYDWIGFSSANAVRATVSRAGGARLRVPAGTRVAAVGPATAAAVRSAGLSVDLEPARSGGAAGLLADWPAPATDGSAVLLPWAAIGLPALAAGLRERGFRVDRVDAYTTVPATIPAETVAELDGGDVDAVLLTSGSTASSLAAQVSPAPDVLIGCIGASTAAAAGKAGLSVGFVADEATAAGLVAALTRALADTRSEPSTSPRPGRRPPAGGTTR
jgi:uroporphyrinogen-III synthase